MIRIIALIAALAAFAPAAQARQPLFMLSVAAPTNDTGAYAISVAPLGRECRPLDVSLYNCLYAVDPGQQLTLTATLAPGYSITGWTGLCAAAGSAAVAVVAVPTTESINGCGLTLAYDAKAAVTGWWWVADEPGRGYSLALNDEGRIFIAAYGYDETGAPHWRSGTLTRSDAGVTATFYRGTIAEHRGGGTLAGGEAGNATRTGRHWTATLGISNRGIASLLSLTDNADGTVVSKRIQRFPIDGRAFQPPPAGAASGWFVDSSQPGVGYFVEQQGNRAFVSAFAYDAAGAPAWYVMGAPVAPTNGGWLMEAAVTAYRGGSPFAAAPPLATPVPVPAGTVAAGLGRDAISLQLSTGRRITLSRFTW